MLWIHLLNSNVPGQGRKAFWLTFITAGGKCLPVYSLALSFSLLKWKCSDKTRVGLWKGVGTLSEDGPFPHCHVSLCKYKTFPQLWWEYLSCFIDSQGTEPGRGAKEWISPFFFWANLDHSDSGDRTFESTVESPQNISLKKFPGVSANAPGWAKVIGYLLISIPIKENLLLGKRKVQSCVLSDCFPQLHVLSPSMP